MSKAVVEAAGSLFTLRNGEYVLDERTAEAVAAPRPAPRPGALDADVAAQVRRLEAFGVVYADAVLVASPTLLRQTVAISHAQEFLGGTGGVRDAGDKSLCVLAGPIGVGKTIAAVYIAAHGRPRRIAGDWGADDGPKFRHASDLVAQMTLLGAEESKAREALRRARILVLDDIGVEEDRRHKFLPFFDWLVNERAGAPGWTVITTNLPLEAFRQRYGERIYDRLRGRAVWYEIDHESLRGT